MSLTSYRAAPSRDGFGLVLLRAFGLKEVGFPRLVRGFIFLRIERPFLSRFGGDLLSHTLRCSTIGATALNGRVREGIGCFARAMTTKPRKKRGVLSPQTSVLVFWFAALRKGRRPSGGYVSA